MDNVIVPAYPYEGAIYWFFESYHRHGGNWRKTFDGSHSYYRTLYGAQHVKYVQSSLAISSLFDNIRLAPADAFLINHVDYASGGKYNNPELRVQSDWDDDAIDRDKRHEIANVLSNDTVISSTFKKIPISALNNIIYRTLLQLEIAQKYNAVILGGPQFHLLRRLIEGYLICHNTDSYSDKNVEVFVPSENGILLKAISFLPENIDQFALIRQNSNVKRYCKAFASHLRSCLDSKEPEKELKSLMREARSKKEIAQMKIAQFQTKATLFSCSSALPFPLSWVSSVGSLAYDLLSRIESRKLDGYRWYLLGSVIQENIMDGDILKD